LHADSQRITASFRAAPYFKQPSEAKDHAFDRERGDAIPASWLKSHARSLVRYHLHPEAKFQGGEYDQRGPLKRRHVFALAHRAIGKEADNIEENEFIGEDADPPPYGVELTARAAIAAAWSRRGVVAVRPVVE
jgi:hypothetical protein